MSLRWVEIQRSEVQGSWGTSTFLAHQLMPHNFRSEFHLCPKHLLLDLISIWYVFFLHFFHLSQAQCFFHQLKAFLGQTARRKVRLNFWSKSGDAPWWLRWTGTRPRGPLRYLDPLGRWGSDGIFVQPKTTWGACCHCRRRHHHHHPPPPPRRRRRLCVVVKPIFTEPFLHKEANCEVTIFCLCRDKHHHLQLDHPGTLGRQGLLGWPTGEWGVVFGWFLFRCVY